MRRCVSVAMVALLIFGCGDDYNDSELRTKIGQLDSRLSALELKINADIMALKTLVEGKKYITKVEKTDDGWEITFHDNSKISITNGNDGSSAPIISVAQKDGSGPYYWKIGDNWLLDGNEEKIPVTGSKGDPGENAIAPQVHINADTNEWEISTDNGVSWIPTGVTATGSDAPIIGVAQDGNSGPYYWKIGDNWLFNDNEEKIPVTGSKGDPGENAIAPKVRINAVSYEWEISTDNGVNWDPTGVIALGENGDAFFSAVNDDPNSDYVEFILIGGGNPIKVPKYKALGLTFTGANANVVDIAINATKTITYAKSGEVTAVGVASATPSGWTVTHKKTENKIEIIAPATAETFDLLVVATSANGASASYWLVVNSVNTSTGGGGTSLVDLIGLDDNVVLAGVEYPLAPTTALTLTSDITIKGTGEDTKITAVEPPVAAGVIGNGANPALYINGNIDVVIEDVTITSTASGTNAVDGITVNGGATLRLKNVVFDGIWNGDFTGMQHGRVITVLDGTLIIENCTFKNFNKNGIHVTGNSNAVIKGCTFEGNKGAVGAAAQNGVVFVGADATGSVTGCTFKGLRWEHNVGDCDNDAWSCGILLYNTTSENITWEDNDYPNTYGTAVDDANDCNWDKYEDTPVVSDVYEIGAHDWPCKPSE
ncbi:MAG: right-handed parallel beta-helix repeat-containing protein [Bacteroidales bacterium]|nr:right-handed parallel beta-helix repeat-containing protein [Bacteroidales bacterium]